MIDWEAKCKELGFDTEKHMWEVLLTSLRNNERIAEYLKVSRGTVHRRRSLLGVGKGSAARGREYRGAKKRKILLQAPEALWEKSLLEVQAWAKKEYEEVISLSYISKFKRGR